MKANFQPTVQHSTRVLLFQTNLVSYNTTSVTRAIVTRFSGRKQRFLFGLTESYGDK